MNLRTILTIGVIAAVNLSPAIAQQQGKTRAQVRAELAEALRTGQLLAPGESGLTQQQQRPDLFPSIAMFPGRSRQEVRNELAEARRTGDLIAGESSARLNEVHPDLYPPVPMAPGKTREQARAELAEALRTGDILAGGESSLTLRQRFPASYQDRMSMPTMARRAD